MKYTVHDTNKSLKSLKRAMRSSDRAFYTRFGDNDVIMAAGAAKSGPVGNNMTVWSPELQAEMQQALNIKDPNYLKAVSLDYKKERGMEEGLFAPFGYKEELIRVLGESLTTGETQFYNPVLFHYLACFKPQKLKNFIAEFIRPKKKLFIGNCTQENMEKIFGPIDYYVEVPRKNAFDKIDRWWPKVLDALPHVDVVLPCAGQATRAIQGRLWKLGAKVHSIDFGSVVDAVDGQMTRTWLKLKGQEVRNFFDDSLRFDRIIPYRPGNLGAAYNEAMANADDWVLFTDDDFILLHPKWYDICLNAIRQVGHKAGWISAVTNRIHCPSQKVNLNDIPDTNDIGDHIKISNTLWDQFGGEAKKTTNSATPFSGFFILTHKKAWQDACGFSDGFLGVDNDYYNKLMVNGYDSYVLPGLYGYHIYHEKKRFNMGNKPQEKALKVVEKPKPKDNTLSVIMMVKDEEENLPRCFESIKGLWDELIVVDTGSTDRTMEICREYGAKVFEHPWENFSKHRNQSVGYATGEWLFQIDADEEMVWDGMTPEQFREWVFGQPENVAGIDFRMNDIRKGRKAVDFPCRRCFRSGKGSYKKIVHNELIVNGEIAECNDVKFNHYGYDISADKKEAKAERSIPLLKKRLKENPCDYDCYFYLCEFYGGLGDYAQAIEYGEKYLKFKHFMGPKFNHTVYYTLANRYFEAQNFKRAHEIILEGLQDDPANLDLNLIYTQYGVMVSDADIVITGARNFIDTYRSYENGDIPKDQRFVFSFNPDTLSYAHYQLAAAHLQAGVHIMKALGGILPGSSDQVKAQIESDCKSRLGPQGLLNVVQAALK